MAGLVLFALLRPVLAEPLTMAAAFFVLFSTFGLVQMLHELPGVRKHWPVATFSVLSVASLAVLLTMVVGRADEEPTRTVRGDVTRSRWRAVFPRHSPAGRELSKYPPLVSLTGTNPA